MVPITLYDTVVFDAVSHGGAFCLTVGLLALLVVVYGSVPEGSWRARVLPVTFTASLVMIVAGLMVFVAGFGLGARRSEAANRTAVASAAESHWDLKVVGPAPAEVRTNRWVFTAQVDGGLKDCTAVVSTKDASELGVTCGGTEPPPRSR